MALTQLRIGIAYLSLADHERAGEGLAAAEKIQTQLVAEFPPDAECINDIALTFIQAGHIHVLMSRFEVGATCYTRAAEQARTAIALAPGRDELKLTLAEALTSLGSYNSVRTPEVALKYHTEVIGLARELTAKPNPSYGARLFLAVGLMNVGLT